MGRRKRVNGGLKRAGSQILDSRMLGEDVSKFYKGRSCPLNEALMRAAIATRPSKDTPRALGKPQQEILVVAPNAVPARRAKITPRTIVTEFKVAGSRKAFQAKFPDSGLPWVKGPEKEGVSESHPQAQTKKSTAKPNERGKSKKLPSMSRGQPRFGGGIKFVQGGLPFLGKNS